ncbi:MAG TPA: iron-sulfur cluster assembly scaffold protein [Dongiaceae bacterium]|nr:iron-sulfur cluster assembly scaffold protein [Dongiaceae bacterium]
MTQALYHSTLVEHAQAGRSRGRLTAPHLSATVDNPLCGDRVTIDLALADDRVAAVGHQVRGCLLCEAAAELAAAGAAARAIVNEGAAAPAGDWSALAVFAPVHDIKSRRDCVLLPFEALAKALK